jgi:hypothetical protein
LRIINPIESVFDTVRTVSTTSNGADLGDQRERRICSSLWFAENNSAASMGYRGLPRLIDILDAQFGSSKVIRRAARSKLALERRRHQQRIGYPERIW